MPAVAEAANPIVSVSQEIRRSVAVPEPGIASVAACAIIASGESPDDFAHSGNESQHP
jgi:hypothetical protein